MRSRLLRAFTFIAIMITGTFTGAAVADDQANDEPVYRAVDDARPWHW